MKSVLIIPFILAVCLAEALPGDWQQVLQSQQKFRNVSLTWAYVRHLTGGAPRSADQIAKVREQFRQQDIANGMHGEELERQVNAAASAFIESAAARTLTGTIVCRQNGSVVSVDAFPDDDSTPIQGKSTISEYWNGAENTRFFRNTAQAGEVERDSPNPFAYTAETQVDIYTLALYPLANTFGEKTLLNIKDGVAHLDFAVPKRDNYDIMCKLDLKTGIPTEVTLTEKSISRVDHRCFASGTQSEQGVVVPSIVTAQTLRRDGVPEEWTSYRLVSADVNAAESLGDIAGMGPKGPVVIDYRLGKGHEITYKYPGHLPTLDEARNSGQPFTRPKAAESASNLPYAIAAAMVAVALLLIALRRPKR